MCTGQSECRRPCDTNTSGLTATEVLQTRRMTTGYARPHLFTGLLTSSTDTRVPEITVCCRHTATLGRLLFAVLFLTRYQRPCVCLPFARTACSRFGEQQPHTPLYCSGVQKLQTFGKSGGGGLDMLSPKIDSLLGHLQANTGLNLPVNKVRGGWLQTGQPQ